ncbi:hypothetical protein B0H14DRAFT_2594588 [Mycena olivaceomarginata]|nr:hypothetical protein B0H14DRAFT_2594588 [Mycena olivaceomarginata]
MPLLHYNQYRNCEEAELFFRLKDFLRHLFRNLSSEHEMTQIWIMEPMDSPSERKKHPKTQVSPSRTPAARRLACAKYRQKKSEAIARKSRISIAHLREETKSDPSAAKLRAEFAQEARAQYEECNRVHRAWKKRFRRLEASYRSEGSRKKNCTPVDYEVEWALYQQMKEDEKGGRVAEALYVPKPDEVLVTRQDGTQGYIYL